MPQRDYIGYEDYSPEGRAAIGSFNAAGGPNFLSPDSDPAAYAKAKQAAEQSAIGKMIMKHLMMYGPQAEFGHEPPPALQYEYPPRE